MTDEVIEKEVDNTEEIETIEEVDDIESIEDEVVESKETTETEEEDKETPVKKPKKSLDDRLAEINTSTWNMREAERKANNALENANAAIAKMEAVSAKAGDPKPEQDDFDDTGEWIEALTTWKAKHNGDPAKPEVSQNNQNQQTPVGWVERRSKAVEKLKGYVDNEKVVQSVMNHYGNVAMQTLLMESERGAEIIHHLGKNHGELERIAQLSPLSVSKEIGKMEDRLTSKRNKTTKAIAPISPVSGGSGSASPATDWANMSDEEFAKKRNEAGL